MLEPMGLPKDVSVIAWGISLERPTMIYYGVDNIRDLFGHKRNFMDTRNNEIAMYLPKGTEESKESAQEDFKPLVIKSTEQTDDLLNDLEESLETNQWAAGDKPTSADREALEKLEYPPNPDTHPYTFAWWAIADRFNSEIQKSWPAPAGGAAPAGGKKPAAKAKKDEVDELDLFGEDDGPAPPKPVVVVKKAKKAPPVAKSLVILEVKPWGPETNLDELGKKIINEVVQDGLVWKTEFKKEPIAYGIHKIVIGCVVEDEKVSVDDL